MSPGNADRQQSAGYEATFAVVMGGVAAAVSVLVAALAAVIVVRRKRYIKVYASVKTGDVCLDPVVRRVDNFIIKK